MGAPSGRPRLPAEREYAFRTALRQGRTIQEAAAAVGVSRTGPSGGSTCVRVVETAHLLPPRGDKRTYRAHKRAVAILRGGIDT